MNTDAVLPNIDLIDDQHFIQFFNSDQNQYLPNNNGDPRMSQLVDDNNQAIHYMPSKSDMINKSHINSSRSSMNSMNANYSHSMNSINVMNSHSQMLNSPPMVQQQIDQNHNNNQMSYCKYNSKNVPISSHYESPPLPRTYQPQGLQNHHSSSSSADLNHFNRKYCSDSNESVNVSSTLTHISETDSSHPHNNYAPTPPQSQSISAVNLNMISTPQTYTSMACNPSNSWNVVSSDISAQMKHTKNNSNHSTFQNSSESHFAYLDQPNTDFLSITSTPMNSHSQPDPYVMRSQNNKTVINQNCINKNRSNAFSDDSPKKPKSFTDNVLSNYVKKDSILAEKRTVVILKVLEQIIDPNTKSVLKETVIKDEEITTSCGEVQFDSLSNDTSTISSAMTRSQAGSSGVLGDISAMSNTKSNISSTNSTDLLKDEFKSDCVISPDLSKKEDLNDSKDETYIGNRSDIDENDEEERRQTASALLALQTVSNTNTPVKEFENDGPKYKVPSTAQISAALSSSTALSSPKESNQTSPFNRNESFSPSEKLKPGVKAMAKWKDKNFYPAEISKQLELHKWSVKFEDGANRNLFETDLIRIEHLITKQDVMLTLSDDLCTRAVIKNVFIRSVKNIEFDLEYLEDEKLCIKRHKLKDIFLTSDQGSTILAKMSKPSLTGAVFADVDLDNIVTGKRSRSKQSNDSSETNTRRADNSDSDTDTGPVKKRRKQNDESKVPNEPKSRITVDCSKKSDFYPFGHYNYHENALAVSPRSSKSALSMPQQELEKILGPMPKSDSKIFNRIGFILTSGDRNKNVFSDHESTAERSIPFDKVYLTKQIIAGSGKVYDTFEEMKSSNDNYECVLIADTYHRSIKYIQCLAAGIPIASHLWVIDSCRANKLVDRDSYILPAGFSVITHSLSSDKNTLKKSSVLFKGMKFYFGSKMHDKLEKLWNPVLFAAQAEIVKQEENMHNKITRKLIDIIIADASCKADLTARARQLRIPVVSSEYIVQCLINGRKLPYDASPYFSHTYK